MIKGPRNDILYFVKPLEVDERFSDFIDYITDQESNSKRKTGTDVKYSQSREF